MRWFFDPLDRGAFRFAMIDVPWRWKNWTQAHNSRSPESKYTTMSMEEAAALPVRDVIRPGGAVWIWCTWPLISEQSMVARNAWGLEIATGGAWVKITRKHKHRVGTGFIMRSVTEPFLIATRGGASGMRGRGVRNLIETIDQQTIYGVAREHSRKPDEAYAMAERLTPGWARADLFARQIRPGWVAWGRERAKYNGQ